MNEDEIEWVERLENCVNDEYEYICVAYMERPEGIEYESVPFGKKRHFWLDVVYDGFEAICEVLKKQAMEP